MNGIQLVEYDGKYEHTPKMLLKCNMTSRGVVAYLLATGIDSRLQTNFITVVLLMIYSVEGAIYMYIYIATYIHSVKACWLLWALYG